MKRLPKETLEEQSSDWWKRFLNSPTILKSAAYFAVYLALIMIVLPAIESAGFSHRIFYALLIVLGLSVQAILHLFLIASRSGYQFSLGALFCLTTIVSLYAMIFSSILKIENILDDAILGGLVAFTLFVFLYRFIGYSLLFTETWESNHWADGKELVPIQWHWSKHIGIAFFVMCLALLNYFLHDEWRGSYFCFCGVIAALLHKHAVTRTSIVACDKGISFADINWRWKDGPLELFEYQGKFHLGPSRLVNNSKWRQYLWPVVPEENLEAVRESIILKQELAERREEYYAS